MKKIIWSESARADVRRLDKPTAMRVFSAIHKHAETGQGDVKQLQGQAGELRLRVGDWRVRFNEDLTTIQVNRVLHRSEAYRP